MMSVTAVTVPAALSRAVRAAWAVLSSQATDRRQTRALTRQRRLSTVLCQPLACCFTVPCGGDMMCDNTVWIV